MLSFTPAHLNTSGTQPPGLDWELSSQENKAATQPLGQMFFQHSEHADSATGGGFALLWRPPLILFVPPCTWNTSAKYMCFPEPAETAAHLATSKFRGDLGVTAWLEMTACYPLALLFDLWLPPWSSHDWGKCSVSQHQKTISKYFVEGFPTVTLQGRVGKQLCNSSLRTGMEITQNKQTSFISCPEDTWIMDNGYATLHKSSVFDSTKRQPSWLWSEAYTKCHILQLFKSKHLPHRMGSEPSPLKAVIVELVAAVMNVA